MSRRSLLVGTFAIGLSFIMPELCPAAETIKMRTLYNKDLSFSDLAKSLNGNRIQVEGFMAPPLKAESRFFVLTKKPMAVCPFCETDADWPDDILAIYTKRIIKIVPFNIPIIASGTLKLGSFTDPETGFVSRIRVTDATYKRR